MKHIFFICAVLFFAAALYAEDTAAKFRAPAVPLVVHDPYFSIWSPADKLTDAETVHWTGAKHPLHLLIRIDGKPYRLMGSEPANVPAMEQTSVNILPMSTHYQFACEEGKVIVGFITPSYPNDLEMISRPVTFIDAGFLSKDKAKKHIVDFYFDAGAEIAVDKPDQSVKKPAALNLPKFKDGDNNELQLHALKVGTASQKILEKKGDNVRIDWGHLIVTTPENKFHSPKLSYHNGRIARDEFAKTGNINIATLPEETAYRVDNSGLALTVIGKNTISVSLAYDDEYSIKYFDGQNLRPWWKQNGKTTEDLIIGSYGTKIIDFLETQEKMMTDLTAVGGKDYAQLCALAFRQVLGANKLVAYKPAGAEAPASFIPLMFSKENFSNGCIATVDIMYPMSPFLLYYNTELMRATLEPEFQYAESERWKFPFAPHDLGTYPHATGQVYGGGETSEEKQMPVEESANMIIVTAALAKREGNADYAKKHWAALTQWAQYLEHKGYDPENQLCTDDFAGHLAHNVNLSAKAIIALGAYAQLCKKLGETESAKKYRDLAASFAKRWIAEASENAHTKLAFDKPGTWSMKYNLVWDLILETNLFPQEVFDKEIAFYKTKMQKYGFPLDSRQNYTKVDWELWCAAMTNNRTDFDAFIKPVMGFINNTDRRVPITDWYITEDAKMKNMQARGVVGGFWMPMLKKR
ncbi:MAG: DUF4965 domain-containing protein [Planctomycetaceae bacterium]|nr:DUF4965 domain-containing protein [Planctomycetaceae bacterium]